MTLIRGCPPLYDEIVARFPLAARPTTVFSWGRDIFCPAGGSLPPEILVHESVHGIRQGDDVVGWWRRYLDDAEFLLAEEVPAHVAELATLTAGATSRPHRRFHLAAIARKLSSSLYGPVVTFDRAKALLKRGLAE